MYEHFDFGNGFTNFQDYSRTWYENDNDDWMDLLAIEREFDIPVTGWVIDGIILRTTCAVGYGPLLLAIYPDRTRIILVFNKVAWKDIAIAIQRALEEVFILSDIEYTEAAQLAARKAGINLATAWGRSWGSR